MITRRDSIQMLGASALALAAASGTLAASPASSEETADPDLLFTEPFIDIDEWRDTPVRHRYVHGGFKGTDALFSMYFPPKERYKGRFFHPINAVPGNENTAMSPSPISMITQENSTVGFAVSSGGYLVESNMGSKTMFWTEDHTITGYRTSAAVARYSRVLAAEMYGDHRPYGYIYGGSGGSQKTIACVENAADVWDGAVPYVTGGPMAMPNMFTVQAHALRVLGDKIDQVVDAVDPGSERDMYDGLNEEERAALLEAVRLGLPPRTLFDHERLGYGPLSNLIDQLVLWDPGYFDDFWKVPGYLGANPPESLKRARIQKKTKITKIIMSDEGAKMGLLLPMAAVGRNVIPAAFEVESLPDADIKGASIVLQNGAAKGSRLSATGVDRGYVTLGVGLAGFDVANKIKVGDEILIDNSIYLASQTYHRHQVPSRDFYVWDQFRGPDGKPIYPQRPKLLGPIYMESGAGSFEETGKYSCKMIIVETLVDEYAYPWQADWYRSQAKKNLGSRLDDNFRLWFVDNAMHVRPRKNSHYSRIINYVGVLQQALRDLAQWVEKGVEPPQSTRYKINDGQVKVPAKAKKRKGVQPVLTLTANGGKRAEVAVGEAVTFSGAAELPPGTGKLVTAEWDFEGAGDYPVPGELNLANSSATQASVQTTYTFSKPGTYFPALRVSSQREGDAKTIYGQIPNLARVRVIVS